MTLRHSYYDELWNEIVDITESDRNEVLSRGTKLMIELAAEVLKSGFDDEHVRKLANEVVRLPAAITMERFIELRTRTQREALSYETRLRLGRRLELRRFYAIHVFMQMCQKTVNIPFAQFLLMMSDSFYRDALENNYDPSAARENAGTQTTYHFCLALFANSGRPTFVPSSGLTEALIHTEFRDVPSEWIQLPHPAVFIEAPVNSGLTVPNAESGIHELVGAFVVAREPDTADQLKLQVLLVGRAKVIDPQKAEKFLFNDALFHFTLVLNPGTTVGACLQDAFKNLGGWTSGIPSDVSPNPDNPVLHHFASPDPDPVKSWQTGGFADCARFVLNTLLYITLPDSEVESAFSDSEIPSLLAKLVKAVKGSKKRTDLNTQLKKKDQHKVMLLGSSVKITRVHGAENGVDGTGHSIHRKLSVAFFRRGHWRNQPFGPGRKQTRLKWILPTMVNPEGPMKVTTYIVES